MYVVVISSTLESQHACVRFTPLALQSCLIITAKTTVLLHTSEICWYWLQFDTESYAHRPLSDDLVKELSTMNKLHDHEDLLP